MPSRHRERLKMLLGWGFWCLELCISGLNIESRQNLAMRWTRQLSVSCHPHLPCKASQFSGERIHRPHHAERPGRGHRPLGSQSGAGGNVRTFYLIKLQHPGLEGWDRQRGKYIQFYLFVTECWSNTLLRNREN